MAHVSTIHNKLPFDRDSHVRSRNLRWTDEYWTLYLYGESNNRIGRLIPSSCIIHSLAFAHSLFFLFRSFWSRTFAKAIHFLSLITRQRIWFIFFIGGNVDNEMHEQERSDGFETNLVFCCENLVVTSSQQVERKTANNWWVLTILLNGNIYK